MSNTTPIVILDIDQDFFFSPILSGTISERSPIDSIEIQQQKQCVGLADVTRVFRPFIDPEKTPLLHATHHNEVGEFLRRTNLQNIILYHLDAHTDIDDQSLGALDMSMSDWISATAAHYAQVYWILSSKEYATTAPVTQLANPPMQTFSLEDLPLPPKSIDLVFWTDSPGWCPQTVDLFSIFKKVLFY